MIVTYAGDTWDVHVRATSLYLSCRSSTRCGIALPFADGSLTYLVCRLGVTPEPFDTKGVAEEHAVLQRLLHPLEDVWICSRTPDGIYTLVEG